MTDNAPIVLAVNEALFDANQYGEVSVTEFLRRLKELGFEVQRPLDQLLAKGVRAMDEDELDRLRGLAQEHVGTICTGPIYPSEVLALVEEIDRLAQVLVLMDHRVTCSVCKPELER